jgi:hypothetical protein
MVLSMGTSVGLVTVALSRASVKWFKRLIQREKYSQNAEALAVHSSRDSR